MAWIPYLSADALDPAIRAQCEAWKCAWDEVDNVLRIHGAAPRAWDGHLALYQAVLRGDSPLTRIQRECIGVVVSAINGCEY